MSDGLTGRTNVLQGKDDQHYAEFLIMDDDSTSVRVTIVIGGKVVESSKGWQPRAQALQWRRELKAEGWQDGGTYPYCACCCN